MRKIKMLTTMAGANISAQPGQEIELPDDQADQLIAGGFAVLIKSDAIETAIIPEPENAMMHKNINQKKHRR